MWRFKTDVEVTLENLLAPFDLTASKAGEKTYRIKTYEYHRKTPEEGRLQVEYLTSLSPSKEAWELRKKELQACMWKAIRLDRMPARPESAPIMANKRTMNGYTIENIALEILPGLYVNGSLYKPEKIKGKIPVIRPGLEFQADRVGEAIPC